MIYHKIILIMFYFLSSKIIINLVILNWQVFTCILFVIILNTYIIGCLFRAKYILLFLSLSLVLNQIFFYWMSYSKMSFSWSINNHLSILLVTITIIILLIWLNLLIILNFKNRIFGRFRLKLKLILYIFNLIRFITFLSIHTVIIQITDCRYRIIPLNNFFRMWKSRFIVINIGNTIAFLFILNDLW